MSTPQKPVISKGQEGYWSDLQSALKPLFDSIRDDSGEFHKVLGNDLFDLPGPRYMSREYSDRERQLYLTFVGYFEITRSYENLTDIDTYLRKFPRRSSGVSRTRYLTYHVENYLNEAYILENRLKSYAKQILRRNRKAPDYSSLCGLAAGVTELVDDSFKGINTARGSHIHQSRFHDDELNRASTWEMIAQTDASLRDPISDEFNQMSDYCFRKAKKKWQQLITANNAAIKLLLDLYFDVLYRLVFDTSAQPRYYP